MTCALNNLCFKNCLGFFEKFEHIISIIDEQPVWIHCSEHILRKVYNCRETKRKISHKFFISCEKIFWRLFVIVVDQQFLRCLFHFSISLPQNSDNLFLVISSISYVISIVLNAPHTTAQTISSDLSCIIHSLNSPVFIPPFSIFPLLHFQMYNYNCTTTNLQLQITFYNCRNSHQLHVKICPAVVQRPLK